MSTPSENPPDPLRIYPMAPHSEVRNRELVGPWFAPMPRTGWRSRELPRLKLRGAGYTRRPGSRRLPASVLVGRVRG